MPDIHIKIKLRPVIDSDAELLFHWRNDPETRRQSLKQEVVEYGSHLKWFTITRLASRILLVEIYNFLLYDDSFKGYGGMVRIEDSDYLKTSVGAEMSWIVAPPFRGHGVGKAMVANAIDQYARNITLGAWIKKTNPASMKVAQANGFFEREDSETEDCRLWVRKPIGI